MTGRDINPDTIKVVLKYVVIAYLLYSVSCKKKQTLFEKSERYTHHETSCHHSGCEYSLVLLEPNNTSFC